MAHNKTLAAQLCNEFRMFFPNNAVEYFVSYYDYYQPEAYVPSKDLYIEKDSAINQEIDRLRHAATAALFARRDVIIVASVSAIFGMGSPETYDRNLVLLRRGEEIDRDLLLRKLVSIQYTRNDTALGRGTFRVRGEALEVFPAYAESAYRATFFGDEVERLQHFDPLTGELIEDDLEHVAIWPATHYNVKEGTIEAAVEEIGRELNERYSRARGSRASCSRPTACASAPSTTWRCCARWASATASRTTRGSSTAARPGDRPYCLIDYFPDDFVCFLDESHQTVPQIGGMYEGDRSRKQTLVDYGFRLPSALDNRPQTFDEFLAITPQIVFVSATPGQYERSHSKSIVEQIVRPTGIVDPRVEVRETRNQIDDLMNEIRMRVDREERTLVTTLTKKMSEDLTDYLLEMGFRVRYLHSEIDTLERIQIIRDLRLGEYDVLVGVNLLREGLDLPEVSLVGILDADKEGFLRGETSLIQTIGRAARNVDGTVLMYADKETAAMRAAIAETDRRRAIQLAYNEEHGITAATIVKGISDIAEFLTAEGKTPKGRRRSERKRVRAPDMSLQRPRADDGRARGGDARRGRGPALRVRRAPARRDPRPAPRAARARGGGWHRGLTRCGPRCSPGTPATRATCRGGGRHDPYAILVSEVMLQQTQVARVVERYEAWLERWPTAAALAAARRDEVLRAWVGLGYNRRALALHEACTIVAADGWPADLETLPGVGPYTAAALGAFAFGRDVVALDTNARRVFARLGTKLTPAPGQGAIFNQATIELGATVCTARAPRCDRCPLRTDCDGPGEPVAAVRPAAGSVRGHQSLRAGARGGRSGLWSAVARCRTAASGDRTVRPRTRRPRCSRGLRATTSLLMA